MVSREIVQMLLDQYTEISSKKDELVITKSELLDAAIPQEVKDALAEIEAEFAPKLEEVNRNIEQILNEIKCNVKDMGESVKGKKFIAVYYKPRITWNSNILEGLALVVPGINEARKVGLPSVFIRSIR